MATLMEIKKKNRHLHHYSIYYTVGYALGKHLHLLLLNCIKRIGIKQTVNVSKSTKGKYFVCGLHFPWKEKEKRLEKHSGSNSKSHRSAVKGQPSWQQRYGGTMVNHSHAAPNNAREGQ